MVKRPAQGSPEDMSQTPKKPGEVIIPSHAWVSRLPVSLACVGFVFLAAAAASSRAGFLAQDSSQEMAQHQSQRLRVQRRRGRQRKRS